MEVVCASALSQQEVMLGLDLVKHGGVLAFACWWLVEAGSLSATSKQLYAAVFSELYGLLTLFS